MKNLIKIFFNAFTTILFLILITVAVTRAVESRRVTSYTYENNNR